MVVIVLRSMLGVKVLILYEYEHVPDYLASPEFLFLDSHATWALFIPAWHNYQI